MCYYWLQDKAHLFFFVQSSLLILTDKYRLSDKIRAVYGVCAFSLRHCPSDMELYGVECRNDCWKVGRDMKGNDTGFRNVQSPNLRGKSPGRKSVTQAGFQPDISRPQIKMIPPELLGSGLSFMGLRNKTVKADSHMACRAHATPMPFPRHAIPRPCRAPIVPCPSWKSAW